MQTDRSFADKHRIGVEIPKVRKAWSDEARAAATEARGKQKILGLLGGVDYNTGLKVGESLQLRQPTEGEMHHESMRFDQAAKHPKGTEAGLHARLNRIKDPQKLYAFHQNLENENFHTFNAKHVVPKLKAMGWKGKHPS